MGKVLTWLGIALVAWAVWRLVLISQRRAVSAREKAAASSSDGDARDEPSRRQAPELMMQCAVCGIHLPGSEARFAGGRVYCSDAHRDQGVRDGLGAGADRTGR